MIEVIGWKTDEIHATALTEVVHVWPHEMSWDTSAIVGPLGTEVSVVVVVSVVSVVTVVPVVALISVVAVVAVVSVVRV